MLYNEVTIKRILMLQNIYEYLLMNKANDGVKLESNIDESVLTDDPPTAVRRRKQLQNGVDVTEDESDQVTMSRQSWKRILLLVIAITVHNIPGVYACA